MMDLQITPAIAMARHPQAWQRLMARAGSAPVRAAYRVRFSHTPGVNHEMDILRPSAHPIQDLIGRAAHVKSLKLVAWDNAGHDVTASLNLTEILATRPQTDWPVELGGQDPALRAARRAAWHPIIVGRAGRLQRETWLLAGLACKSFRGGEAWVAELIKDEKTALLVEDPDDPARLVDHDLTIHSLERHSFGYAQDLLHARIARHYPGYLFGHRFINVLTDEYAPNATRAKQWEWYDANSRQVNNWIQRHTTATPQGLTLILEDTPRLDVRDYRDTHKPRRVLA